MVLFCNELQLQLANNINKTLMNIKARFALWVLNINVFSKKGIRNSQSNMQTTSISPQNRTKIQSLQN